MAANAALSLPCALSERVGILDAVFGTHSVVALTLQCCFGNLITALNKHMNVCHHFPSIARLSTVVDHDFCHVSFNLYIHSFEIRKLIVHVILKSCQTRNA